MRLPACPLFLMLVVGLAMPMTAAEQAPVVAPKPAVTSYLLQYKFKKGQKLHYKDSLSRTFEAIKGDKRELSVQKTVYEKHLQVDYVSKDGSFILRPTLDHVKMSAQFNDTKPITYDSHNKTAPPRQFRGIDEAIGKALWKLKISPAGKLLERFDLRPQEKIQSNTKLVKAEEEEQNSRKNFFLEFPEEKTKVGQSWKEYYFGEVSIPQSIRKLPIKFLRTHTLTAVKQNIATISVRTAVLTRLSDPQLQVQLIQRRPVSTIQFDIKRGIMLSRTTTVDEKVFAFAGSSSVVKAESIRKEVYVENP